MADKSKDKENKAVAPWRPFTGLTGGNATWTGC
jgi:hypothetical protein